jgi:hypothetical protein
MGKASEYKSGSFFPKNASAVSAARKAKASGIKTGTTSVSATRRAKSKSIK